jgi:hypothetical protein
VGRSFIFPVDISPCPNVFHFANIFKFLAAKFLASALEKGANRPATNSPLITAINVRVTRGKIHITGYFYQQNIKVTFM